MDAALGLSLVLLFSATGCVRERPPRLPHRVGPIIELGVTNSASSELRALRMEPLIPSPGLMGTQHPMLLKALGHEWLVACQARKDTDGDGSTSAFVGQHGEVIGDSMQLYLFYGGGSGVRIDSFVATEKSRRFLAYTQSGKLMVLDTQAGARSDLSPLGNLDNDSLVFVPGHRMAVIQRVGTWSRLLLLNVADSSGEVVYQTRFRVLGLAANANAIEVYEARRDTNRDGKIGPPQVVTNKAVGVCSGPASSSTSFMRGDRPTVHEVPIPKVDEISQRRGEFESARGCTTTGETVEARLSGPCEHGKQCESLLLLAGSKDSWSHAVAEGPARWADSGTVSLQPCDGGWAGLLSRLEVAAPHPGKYVLRPWWYGVDFDKDCQDGREELLIERSEIPVGFETEKKCKVANGRWTDQYTGEVLTNPREIKVDHIVPLAEAHATGGEWKVRWHREAFSNDKRNLAVVRASVALEKGSRGPEKWLPPNENQVCGYIKTWIEVKARERLTVTESEYRLLSERLAACSRAMGYE